VSIQYVYINQASTSLTISASGTATVYGYVQKTPAGKNIYLTSNIDSSNPIAMWIAWDNGDAHAVVCAGTKTISGTNYLYVIDPWEDTDSTWYGYEAIKNGTTLLTGKGKYTKSFWKN